MSDAALAALLRNILASDDYVSQRYGKAVDDLSRPALPSNDARLKPPQQRPAPISDSPASPDPEPPRHIPPCSSQQRPAPLPDSPASPDPPSPASPDPPSPIYHSPSPTPSESAMDVQYASASESDAEFSPESEDSSSDGYTLVGKKRKAKASQCALKAQKTAAEAPAPASAARKAKPPSQTTSHDSTKKGPVPPPIYLQDKAKWLDVANWCNDRKISYTSAKSTGTGIRITVPTSTDHRDLTRLLRERKVSFHTYALQEERLVRVVIRGVPKELETPAILNDLQSQKIPVVEVHRMHRQGGEAFNMILAVCEKSEGYKAIFNLSSVCHLSGISVERPFKTGVVGQCHNCQLYGHSQRNCFAKPRCVKCLGDHATPDCDRPKDRNLCTEPPSCVLCGETGHPANYRGCPKAPKKSSPHQAKRAAARSKRECPSLSNKLPTRLSPQRPAEWNLLDHQNSFPPLPGQKAQPPASSSLPTPPAPSALPAPSATLAPSALPAPLAIPAPSALSAPHARPPPPAPAAVTSSYAAPKATNANKALQATKPASATKAPQATKPATASATTFAPHQSSHLIPIVRVYQILESERAKDLARELKLNEGNPLGLIQTYMSYPDITNALASLSFSP